MNAAGQWAAVAAVGGLAALARFRLDAAVSSRLRGDLPWGTLAVNLLGALGAGLVAAVAPGETWRLLLVVGALGSFSTFSTWMLETQRLAEDGRAGLAVVNLVASMTGGLALCGLGWWLGNGL
jgi:fluoride exporter